MYKINYQWTDTRPKPTAHITRGKSRLKGYNDTFYLRDGSNFEIELYNPTQGRVLANISVNGVRVSAGGIIVNPGQRVFLERFIDEDRRFEFSTYWVGKTDQDKTAIEHNGRVEVSFSQEVDSPSWAPYWGGLSTGTGSNLIFGNGTGVNDQINQIYWLNRSSTFNSSINNAWLFNDESNLTYTSKASPKRTETGRVEKGEKSDQILETAHGNFYQEVCASYCFKIMPESQKTVEVGEVRSYCPGCGARIKKSTWKFCPSCGEKLID
jgi:hypothetical protein